MATVWNGTFEAEPANTDNVSSGDDEIRTLKGAITERMGNDHTEYGEDSTAGLYTKDWLHKGGSAVALLQDAAPTTRLSGENLADTARDKGYLWLDDDNEDVLYFWNGTAMATPGLVLTNKGADPAAPVTGQMWIRTDV